MESHEQEGKKQFPIQHVKNCSPKTPQRHREEKKSASSRLKGTLGWGRQPGSAPFLPRQCEGGGEVRWAAVPGCVLQGHLTIWGPGGGGGCHSRPSGPQHAFYGLGWPSYVSALCCAVAPALTLCTPWISLLEHAFFPWCACDTCVHMHVYDT